MTQKTKKKGLKKFSENWRYKQGQRLRKVKFFLKDFYSMKKNYLKKLAVIFFITLFSVLLSNFFFFGMDILETIIVSASIIVTLITGFLFTEYGNFKRFRLEKLNNFIELQGTLRPYMMAFSEVARQFMSKFPKIDFLLGKDYQEFKDINFWDTNKKAYGIDFVRSLYEIGSNFIHIPEFETTHSIMSETLLDNMYAATVELSSILERRKHYKYIFRDLELLDSDSFERIKLVEDIAGFRHLVNSISGKYNGDWRYLDFWQYKIDEFLEILTKMKANSKFIYSFKSNNLSNFSFYLISASIFGVIMPILTISLSYILPFWTTTILTNLSVVGFIVFFVLTLWKVYSYINDKRPSLY